MFHCLFVPDSKEPICVSADTQAELAALVAPLLEDGASGHLYFFKGERLYSTSGPRPYLLTNDGPAVPLFIEKQPGPVSHDGRLGEQSPALDKDYAQLTPPDIAGKGPG